jgi:hypothetical protein
MGAVNQPLQGGALVAQPSGQPLHQGHLAGERPTVVCAWHRPAPVVLVAGGAALSHGCCDDCLARVLGETGDSLVELAGDLRAFAVRG